MAIAVKRKWLGEAWAITWKDFAKGRALGIEIRTTSKALRRACLHLVPAASLAWKKRILTELFDWARDKPEMLGVVAGDFNFTEIDEGRVGFDGKMIKSYSPLTRAMEQIADGFMDLDHDGPTHRGAQSFGRLDRIYVSLPATLVTDFAPTTGPIWDFDQWVSVASDQLPYRARFCKSKPAASNMPKRLPNFAFRHHLFRSRVEEAIELAGNPADIPCPWTALKEMKTLLREVASSFISDPPPPEEMSARAKAYWAMKAVRYTTQEQWAGLKIAAKNFPELSGYIDFNRQISWPSSTESLRPRCTTSFGKKKKMMGRETMLLTALVTRRS